VGGRTLQHGVGYHKALLRGCGGGGGGGGEGGGGRVSKKKIESEKPQQVALGRAAGGLSLKKLSRGSHLHGLRLHPLHRRHD
jgi:hypothetical protein